MPRQRLRQTAPGQAALLFAVAGALGLVSETLLTAGGTRMASVVVNVSALVASAVIYVAPWHRWRPGASLVLVVLALVLIVAGQRTAPGAPTTYGVWYIVLFAWVGFWHAPRTVLYLTPLGAAAYVAPFIGVPSTPRDAIASVAIAIPAAAILGEVLATKMETVNNAQRELIEARGLLERANLTDDLTGVGNRRRANALLDSMRPGDGLVVLDLDHFKAVNDTLGHAEGDRVLSALGEYLRSAVRDVDTVARFGGEEFLLLLRGAGHQAGDASLRLLAGWRDRGIGVTLSAGAAVHNGHRSPDATFRAADAAMYAAKRAGRDRVVLEGDGPATPAVSASA